MEKTTIEAYVTEPEERTVKQEMEVVQDIYEYVRGPDDNILIDGAEEFFKLTEDILHGIL